MNSQEIRIDVRGVKINLPEIEIRVKDVLCRFVLDENSKQESTFHAGLFVNQQAANDTALQYPREQRFCALLESPINPCYADLDTLVDRFDNVLTHQQNLIDRGHPFRELMFGTNWIGIRTDADATAVLDDHPVKTRNVSFMGSIAHDPNGAYEFRQKIASEAIGRGDVDCFGKGIREVPGKREAIAPYRFSIAMENAASDHYFSEKLVDCFLLETIPIYYGCPGIGNLFDQRGILRFNNHNELIQILNQANEETYDSLLTHVHANKETVIAQGWHSHRSLFQRIAPLVVEKCDATRPVKLPRQRVSGIRRKLGRLLGRIENS